MTRPPAYQPRAGAAAGGVEESKRLMKRGSSSPKSPNPYSFSRPLSPATQGQPYTNEAIFMSSPEPTSPPPAFMSSPEPARSPPNPTSPLAGRGVGYQVVPRRNISGRSAMSADSGSYYSDNEDEPNHVPRHQREPSEFPNRRPVPNRYEFSEHF